MAKRMKRDLKNCSYLDLGKVLEFWREEKFSSSLAMFRDKEFTFSYSTYAAFESGQNIPTVSQVMELAKALGQDPADALIVWVQVQMPTPELKALFRARGLGTKREKLIVNPPAPDSLWTLNPRELEHVAKYPWLTEIFRRLTTNFPKAMPLADLNRSGLSLAKFKKTCIDPLLQSGFLVFEKEMLRLILPHVHIPQNDAGNGIRWSVVENSVAEMIAKLRAKDPNKDILFQAHSSRMLTQAQANRWHTRLEDLENEFLAIPFAEGENLAEIPPFTWISLFGRR
jgi:hypothetical protein